MLGRRRILRISLATIGLSVLVVGGCTPIATVKSTSPHYTAAGNPEPALIEAEKRLANGADSKSRNPTEALGEYLASARAATDQLKQHPDDKQARELYNFAVARSLEVIESARLNP